MKRRLTSILFYCACLQCLSGQAHAAEDESPLNAMGAYFAKLNGFRVEAIVTTPHGEPKVFRFAALKPNQLALVYTHGLNGFTAMCDGSKLVVAAVNDGEYVEYDPPRNMDAMFDSKTTSGAVVYKYMHPSLLALLTGNPRAVFKNTFSKGIKDLGQEKMAGKMCHHVQALTRDAVMDFWIAAGKQPLLMRAIARDLLAGGKIPAGDPTKTALEDASFFGWEVNPVVSVTEFQFDNLEGLKKKDRLTF